MPKDNIFLAVVSGGIEEFCKSLTSSKQKFPVLHQEFLPFGVLTLLDAYRSTNFLKEGGFNWVMVIFENGWGPEVREFQKTEMAPFLRDCRSSGIKTLAYISLTNCFVEAQKRYYPESWIQRKKSGEKIFYFGMPQRYMMCLKSGWLEVIEKTGIEAVDFGFDGVFFDNVWQKCKCSRCQKFSDKQVINQSLGKLIKNFRSRKKDLVVVGNTKLRSRGSQTLTVGSPVLNELDWLQYEINTEKGDSLAQIAEETKLIDKPVLVAVQPYHGFNPESLLKMVRSEGRIKIIVKLWNGETSFGYHLWRRDPVALLTLKRIKELRLGTVEPQKTEGLLVA